MTQDRREGDIVNDAIYLSIKAGWVLCPEVTAHFDEIDIGRRQLQILFFLEQNGPSHARVLASELCMSAPTVSKTVSSLAKRGFVARDEDPNDRRVVYCRLLDKGSRLIRGGWEIDRVLARELLNRLTPQHISYIHESLKEILRAENTVEVEIDCGDSDPQQQRQSKDMIEECICLWDKAFLDMSSMVPYELYELGVRIPEIRMLQYLSQNGSVSMGAIARWMNVRQPTATGVVNRLVERGLVVRERDHGDWRVVLCRLTDMGRRLIGAHGNPIITEFRSRLEMLTNRQLQNLVRALRAVLRASEAMGVNPQLN
jgi:DNA-binding MarR family transcriptional regulator